MKKFFLFIVILTTPLKGFCFPDIPRSDWNLDTLMDFFEEPQYFDRGSVFLNVVRTENRMTIGGRSRNHSIFLEKWTYLPIQCRITDKTGQSEYPLSKEEYQHPKYKNRLVWFFYFEKGVLVIEPSKDGLGKIHWASCRWQTYEMIDETSPPKDEIPLIHKAIESNDWTLTESLIETGVDIDSYALINMGRQKYFGPPAIRLVKKINPSLSEQENKTILNLIKKNNFNRNEFTALI